MVLDKETGKLQHDVFSHITEYIKPGDCLMLNDTKVLPARLYGSKEGTGAKIEVLLLKQERDDVWETLVKPAKRIKVGSTIVFGDGKLSAVCTGVLEHGGRILEFKYDGIFYEILEKLGEMPLPPYIKEQLDDHVTAIKRYMRVNGDLQRHLPLACILRRICLRNLKGWVSTSPSSRCMSGLVHSVQ